MVMVVAATVIEGIKATLVLGITGCSAMVIVIQIMLAVLVNAGRQAVRAVTHSVIAMRARMSQRGSGFQG